MSLRDNALALLRDGYLSEPMQLRAVDLGILTPADLSAAVQAKVANAATIRAQAQTALTSNATYIAIASPTNAQVAAQVKALTRQMDGVIRLLLAQLDATG